MFKHRVKSRLWFYWLASWFQLATALIEIVTFNQIRPEWYVDILARIVLNKDKY